MGFFIIGLILFILSIIICIYCTKKFFYFKQINEGIKDLNEDLLKSNNNLIESNQELLNMEKDLQQRVYNERQNLLNVQHHSESLAATAYKAFENYCDILDSDYEHAEEEYQNAKKLLEKAYDDFHQDVLDDIALAKRDLEKIRSTRAAAIEAQNKEKEIQERLDFYCIRPSEDELFDIHVLERVKPKLHQPRILCMLIWSTYFQKPMTALCNNVLGAKEKCGIYKITNQTNNMCYIGQSVDIAKRWKDHAKCGLGIDTPVKNKLYKAMQEDGLENFSWELLEECPKEDLNEKEKFYIDLYQADTFGYNSNKGIG